VNADDLADYAVAAMFAAFLLALRFTTIFGA
jgi:hypothetical protein